MLISTVTDQLIDKVINRINEPLAKLNDTVNSTKNFLDAASQKQAADSVAAVRLTASQSWKTSLFVYFSYRNLL